jgi:hypothetical protein
MTRREQRRGKNGDKYVWHVGEIPIHIFTFLSASL